MIGIQTGPHNHPEYLKRAIEMQRELNTNDMHITIR